VEDARKLGINAINGLYMLVMQAALASEKFIETNYSNQKIDEVYEEILSLKEKENNK
jgi:shikimate 5-dehydrogenase